MESPRLEALYTLRAEDLSEEELVQLTADVPGDESILRRLMGPGPKLLKGPRGSGKSNYLKRAFYQLRGKGNVLVAYVNFSQHLALEPLMLRSERALEFFRQWLVYKIVIAIADSAGPEAPPDLIERARRGRQFVRELQTSIGNEPDASPPPLAPADLLSSIENWCLAMGKSRAVILMDDAAHAFMQQQQREFFEVFRALRSRSVACKAAIYPGVTSYSPFFNVGHEAEEIEAWIRTDSPTYLEAMRAIFRARFPLELQNTVRSELVDLAALASFGLPRNFLNILSDALGDLDEDRPSQAVLTFNSLRDAVRQNSWRVAQLYEEVARKLPRYENFVNVGREVEATMLEEIRATNRHRREGAAGYIGVAVARPWDPDLSQVFSIQEYAGLLRRLGPVSRGASSYEKIQLHTSRLIAENALGLGRNPSAEHYIRVLIRQSADDFVRRQPDRLFTAEQAEKCRLNLSPCPKCGSPRISDDAAFCFKCGTPLREQSVYRELLSSDISRLQLPPLKQQRILEMSDIRTVQDILLDDAGVKLRSVSSIGKTWSARIRARAEEFVTL